MGIIRALLAFAVVFAHSPWNGGVALVGGRNAVQLFYVISGFLIAHVLRTNTNYRNPLRFYANRALRIYPAYYIVLLFSLGPALLTQSPLLEFIRNAGVGAKTLLLLANVAIFGQDWVMFGAVEDGALILTADFSQAKTPLYLGLVIPQAWTLGVELTFYAIAPFLLRRNSWILIALILSFAVRGWLFYVGIGTHDPWSYRFFPAELSLFLLGALANRIGVDKWQRLLSTSENVRGASVLATATLCIVICTYFFVPISETIKTISLMTVFSILLPLVFLYRPKGSWDKFLGDLSYPVYISHIFVILVIGVIVRRLSWHPSAALITAMNLIFSVVFATLLNQILERPLERLRTRVRLGRSALGTAGDLPLTAQSQRQ